MPRPSPPHTEKARDEAKRVIDLFEIHLKKISETIALALEAEQVLMTHVREAHATLKRCGLIPRRWFTTTEFEVGVGSLILGLAPSFSSISYQILSEQNKPFSFDSSFWFYVVSVPLTLFALGGFLAIHGWVRVAR
jgi:hypothetical protein